MKKSIRKHLTLIASGLCLTLAIALCIPATPVLAAENPDIEVNADITIDGYYSDWNGLPITPITYLADNAYAIHEGQIYTDGERVYVHFKMNDLYRYQMQVQQMTFEINGRSFAMSVLPMTPDGQIDWDFYGEYGNCLPEGTHTNYGVVVDYTKIVESEVAYTIYDPNHSTTTPGDEIEFSFSLEDFCALTGMQIDTVASMTLFNVNIGPEGLKWIGTPTGAFVGVLAAATICGAGYFTYKNKKKKGQGHV